MILFLRISSQYLRFSTVDLWVDISRHLRDVASALS